MATFTLTPGLDEKVAVMVAPEVRKIAEKLADQARRRAPGTKRWVTVADPLVRHTHVQMHDKEVPENLRFQVPSMDWDMKHRGVGPITYMMQPRDESSRAVANVRNCRCVAVLNPAAIAEKIKVGPTEILGPEIRIRVYCESYQVVQCETGDVYPDGNTATGTQFMRKAAAAVAAQSRSR